MKQRLQRLTELFIIFFKISAVSVGGGLTMLPLMTREFVEKRRWLTDEDMVDTVAVMQSVPGIIAINMGILIGYKVAKLPGVLAAAVAVVLPPFIVIVIIAMFIMNLQGSAAADQIFLGVRAAVCALILVSVIKLSRQILKGVFPLTVAAIGFISLVFFNVNAIWLIAAAAAAGLGQGLCQYLALRRRLKGERQ